MYKQIKLDLESAEIYSVIKMEVFDKQKQHFY